MKTVRFNFRRKTHHTDFGYGSWYELSPSKIGEDLSGEYYKKADADAEIASLHEKLAWAEATIKALQEISCVTGDRRCGGRQAIIPQP